MRARQVNAAPSRAEAVSVAEDIGFAIATIKAFMEKPGVSGKQVREAIERLERARETVGYE